MKRFDQLRKQFNPRFLLIRILINAVVLFVVALVTPIYVVDRTGLDWLFLALMLGVLNAVLRPVLQFLTLSLVFVTYGVVVILINAFLLWMLAYLFPQRLEVPSFFWAFVGGAIMGMLSSFLESLLGLNTPIVPESEAELRQRLERRPAGFTNFVLASTNVLQEEAEAPAPAPIAAATTSAPVTTDSPPAEEEQPQIDEDAATGGEAVDAAELQEDERV